MKLNEERTYFGLHFQRDKVCNDGEDNAASRGAGGRGRRLSGYTESTHRKQRINRKWGQLLKHESQWGGALHIQTMKDGRVSEWMVIRMNGEWWVNQQFGGRDA